MVFTIIIIIIIPTTTVRRTNTILAHSAHTRTRVMRAPRPALPDGESWRRRIVGAVALRATLPVFDASSSRGGGNFVRIWRRPRPAGRPAQKYLKLVPPRTGDRRTSAEISSRAAFPQTRGRASHPPAASTRVQKSRGLAPRTPLPPSVMNVMNLRWLRTRLIETIDRTIILQCLLSSVIIIIIIVIMHKGRVPLTRTTSVRQIRGGGVYRLCSQSYNTFSLLLSQHQCHDVPRNPTMFRLLRTHTSCLPMTTALEMWPTSYRDCGRAGEVHDFEVRSNENELY